MNRLQERYENEVVKSLMEKFNYSSKMQAPKIEKIVLNIGVGDAVSNSKLLDDAVNELTLITGQKPVVTRAVSNNSFDGRGNYTLGVKEQLIFPEIDFDKVNKLRGMDIVFVTTAKTDEEGHELLAQLGMPFHK